jgi:hypothetical protein
MKTLLTLLFAASLFVVGCGGGSGGSAAPDPPVAEKPSDIWQGAAYDDDGTEESLTCVITPGLTVVCATDGDREFDGKVVELEEKTLRIEYEWIQEITAAEKGPGRGEGVIDCEWSAHESMDCDYLGVGEDGHVESGHVVLSHVCDHADEAHSRTGLQHRRVNQSHVAGTWIDVDGPIPMINIDQVGRAFGQDATTGCYVSGDVDQVANPKDDVLWRNYYTVTLKIEGCEAEAYAAYNGKMLRGIAFLDDERLHNDTLRIMGTASCPKGPAAFTAAFRRQ